MFSNVWFITIKLDKNHNILSDFKLFTACYTVYLLNFSQLVILFIQKCGLEEVKIVLLCSVAVTSDSQKTFENFYMLLPQHVTSAGSRPSVWGGSQIGRGQKGLHLLKYQRLSATVVGYHTKVVTFCRPRKWLFLLVELCNFSGNNHSLKAL